MEVGEVDDLRHVRHLELGAEGTSCEFSPYGLMASFPATMHEISGADLTFSSMRKSSALSSDPPRFVPVADSCGLAKYVRSCRMSIGLFVEVDAAACWLVVGPLRFFDVASCVCRSLAVSSGDAAAAALSAAQIRSLSSAVDAIFQDSSTANNGRERTQD